MDGSFQTLAKLDQNLTITNLTVYLQDCIIDQNKLICFSERQ